MTPEQIEAVFQAHTACVDAIEDAKSSQQALAKLTELLEGNNLQDAFWAMHDKVESAHQEAMVQLKGVWPIVYEAYYGTPWSQSPAGREQSAREAEVQARIDAFKAGPTVIEVETAAKVGERVDELGRRVDQMESTLAELYGAIKGLAGVGGTGCGQ